MKKMKVLHIERAKILLILSIITVFFISCVEQYSPEVNAYENLMVINGSIIKGNSIQTVTVSKTASIMEPDFYPVKGCQVTVTDNSGNIFTFYEEQDGIYTTSIDESYLSYGSTFSLFVKTPDNKEYESEIETIYESSPIDSLFYEVESKQTSTEFHEQGLQFYVDLKAPEDATHRYLFDLIETYEIHTFYENEGFWDEDAKVLPVYNPLKDSIDVCWNTQPISAYYTTSTENLTVNEKKKIPLSYVPSSSPRLNFRYSLLVKQHALGQKAYQYHEQTNSLTDNSGNLYDSQPPQAPTNISNINNPDEKVLGYFWASSYSEKRIFFDGPLTAINDSHCDEIVECRPAIRQSLIDYFKRINRSVYLIALEKTVHEARVSVGLWAYPYNQICIDCTADGASTEKPSFWDE